MAITTNDIAKIAGVSQSTVSRCLNNSSLVSEKTKKRIKKIAEELGFEFNANARSLSTSKTGTIGVIYPENFADFSINFYFSSLHNQLRESLEREDLDLIVAFSKNRFTGKNNIKKLITRKKIDGLIIVHSQLDDETLSFLNNSKVPFVFLHHYLSLDDSEDADVIYTDHFKGGYLATEHLIKLGHQKIMCISAVGEGDEFKLRTQGYKAALSNYNLSFDEQLLFYGDITFQSSYRIVKENVEKLKKISAIFAQTDMMALGAMEALRELHIEVPQDIALVGYDDIELSTCFKPYLTTIHQPREEISLLACERLIELLNSNKPIKKRKIAIQPKLIIRESCGSKK
ncbi:LacI family DNA-binding transcriptional regulator [Petroclostridium xylanilyticum]|uniref:LacI family DNA-binding transcriptional regulator n=1 Tax=Petroclostridium xylanilyticum TaxID=1792311 RepID=UPI000B993DE0|nr:LacI family DNA-binding transcriptional regulator [Petroclostridium xylanilyticum]